MKALRAVTVPYELSNEEQKRRLSIFNNEVNEICERYISQGFEIIRGFVFNERLDKAHPLPSERTLYEFDPKYNIPVEMQDELAAAWCKLFR